MASFVTTEPPLPHIINYNIRGAYHLLLYAFSGTLSVIIIGSAILYAMSEMKRDWVMNVCLQSIITTISLTIKDMIADFIENTSEHILLSDNYGVSFRRDWTCYQCCSDRRVKLPAFKSHKFAESHLGLLIAAFKSHDTLAKVGGVFTVLIPASMAPVYLFSLRYSRRRKEPVDGTGATNAADRTRDQVNGEYKEEEDTRENTV